MQYFPQLLKKKWDYPDSVAFIVCHSNEILLKVKGSINQLRCWDNKWNLGLSLANWDIWSPQWDVWSTPMPSNHHCFFQYSQTHPLINPLSIPGGWTTRIISSLPPPLEMVSCRPKVEPSVSLNYVSTALSLIQILTWIWASLGPFALTVFSLSRIIRIR